MRAKHAVTSKKRHKKVLRRAKGFYGGRSRLYTVAHHATRKAMAYQFRDRRRRKRDFRRLWIIRIGAAARTEGLSYSKLVHLMNRAGVQVDRKMLSDIAITDPGAFRAIVASVRDAA